jgi:hypothetical protein
LVSSDVGEGIFFAGQNHVALRVVASDQEHAVITTNPEEILAQQAASTQNKIRQALQNESLTDSAPKPATPPAPTRKSPAPSPVAPIAGVSTTPAASSLQPAPEPELESATTDHPPTTNLSRSRLTEVFSADAPDTAEASESLMSPDQNQPPTNSKKNDEQEQFTGHYSIDDYQPPGQN